MSRVVLGVARLAGEVLLFSSRHHAHASVGHSDTSALMEGNLYDGHTLSDTLTAVEHVTGLAVTDTCVDKGYRGHGYIGGAEVRAITRTRRWRSHGRIRVAHG